MSLGHEVNQKAGPLTSISVIFKFFHLMAHMD